LINRADACWKRSAPAGLNHGLDVVPRAGKHCFDRTIAAIAHPATQAPPTGLVFDEGPIADALHLPMHNDMADDNVAAHARSPASITHAPVQRDTARFIFERLARQNVIVSALADVDARRQPIYPQCVRTTQS
jgi:hypothetical protein